MGFKRPGVALGVALCTYGIEQALQANSAWFTMRQSLVNYATGVTVIVALVGVAMRHDLLRAGYPREGWLTAALLAFAAASCLWSAAPDEAVGQLRGAAPYLLVFAGLSPLLLTRTRDLGDAFNTLLLLGTVLLVLLYRSDWQGREIIFVVDSGYAQLKGNPLSVGSLGGMVAIAAVLMNFRGAGRFWQAARWPIFVFALAVILKSGSRGQFFGALIAIAALYPLSRRVRNFGSFAALVAGLGIVAVLTRYAMEQFIEEAWRWDMTVMADTFADGRLGTAELVLAAWFERGPVAWVIGLGSSASFRVIGFYPHLVPAEVLAELGLVGLALFAALAWRAARSGWAASRDVVDDPVARGRVAALLAMALYNFILSLKSGSLLGGSIYFMLLIAIGRYRAVIEADRLETEEWAEEWAGARDEASWSGGAWGGDGHDRRGPDDLDYAGYAGYAGAEDDARLVSSRGD